MDQLISSLDLPQNITNKLEQMGFYYCKDITENYEKIQEKIDVPWPQLIQAPQSKTALQLLEEDTQWPPVRTSIFQLDVLLKDLISPGLITELSGFPGTGKTQICFHLSVGVSRGVNDGHAFFISTNKNFVIDRLREIAQKYVSNVDCILGRIYCLEATDPTELLATLRFLESWLQDHNHAFVTQPTIRIPLKLQISRRCVLLVASQEPFGSLLHVRLLIIDSISWPVKQVLPLERTQYMYTFLQDLRKLASQYKFPIVITNDLTTMINKDGSQFYTSSLGSSFYHIIDNRVLLKKDNSLFKAEVLKNVTGGHLEACFSIH